MSGLTEKDMSHRKWAGILSLFVSTVLMFLKFWAHNLTGSEAVYSDAVESIVNVVAALLALLVVYYANKPADKDHPYGHGKVEYFSSAFEGGLISFASAMIIINSIRVLLGEHDLQKLDLGLAIVVGAGIVNLVLGLFLIRRGRQLNSPALSASGHHVISDSVTSAGVAIGLVLIKFTGWVFLDGIIAIIVGGYLAYTGLKLVRSSIGSLMDEEDLEVLNDLADVFEKQIQPGMIQLHHVKVIRSGHYHHIDAHIVLPEFWDVSEVHDKITQFEERVLKSYGYGGEMNFHVDPCRQVYCQVCDLSDCKIRKEQFKERIPVKLDHLRSRDEPEEFQPTYRS